MFLLYTVSVLCRSCRFVKTPNPNPLANDNLNLVLDNDELGMIIRHDDEHWWNNCNYKVTRNAVSDMFAHISFDNKEFSL